MGLYLNPNADAPDGCAGPVYAFRLTNLEPGIGYRVRVSNVTGGGDYRTRCRSKADSAFYTSELDGLLEEGLGITGTGLFKEETDDMRYLQSLYRSERGDSIDNTAAYIFILPKASVDGVKGDMPLTRPVGYVFANGDTYADGQTIAHELGHGLYSFQHAFDYMGVSQGETDNLMDYGLPQGEHLAVWQWNLISTHKNYTVPFLTDDEDGMKNINGFSVGIEQPNDYDGRNYIYDDGGCNNNYTLAKNRDISDLKKCYQKYEGKYMPLILVARGRTAKFTLKLSHSGAITDNDKQYDFKIEEADFTNGISFKKTEFKMSDLNNGIIDIEFTIDAKEYPEIKDPDTKKFILVKDYKENILAKVQYLSLVPKTAKYKLVYLADKNNNVRSEFNAEVFNKTLNDFHGSLFIKWENEGIETITKDETFKTVQIGEYEDLLQHLMVQYYRATDSNIDKMYTDQLAKIEATAKKNRNLYEESKLKCDNIKKEIKMTSDKAKKKELQAELEKEELQCKKYDENARAGENKEKNREAAYKRTLNIVSMRQKKQKVFFVTSYKTLKDDQSEVGGGALRKNGFGALFQASKFPDIYKVCVHEFAHFLNIPDANLLEKNKDHKDNIYFLDDRRLYDNFMYYKELEDIKKVNDKRWFFYQMKRAYNDWDTYCKEDDN